MELVPHAVSFIESSLAAADIFSDAVYVYEAYSRHHNGSDHPEVAAWLFVASLIFFGLTMMIYATGSCCIWSFQEGPNGPGMCSWLSGCFWCFLSTMAMPALLVWLAFQGDSDLQADVGTHDRTFVSVKIGVKEHWILWCLIGWQALTYFCVFWVAISKFCEYDREKDSAAIVAGTLLPIVGPAVKCRYRKSEDSERQMRGLKLVLICVEDVPDLIIAIIDMWFFGWSYFALGSLIASIFQVFFSITKHCVLECMSGP